MDDDLVANFVAITGASEQVARQLLEIAGGNIEQAAVLFYDTDMAETLARQPAPATSSSAAAAARDSRNTPATFASRTASSSRSRPSRAQAQAPARSREDPDGVITIDDSDDDDENNHHDDMDFDELEDLEDIDDDDDDDNDDDNDDVIDVDAQMSDAAAAETVARTAQEEEDAAMAKRLQEEMYAEPPGGGRGGGGDGGGLGGGDDDDIRAPLGRTTEMLVEPSYVGGSGGYGSYGSESIYDQMRAQRLRQAARGPRNPFNQVWDNDPDAAEGSSSTQTSGVTDGASPAGPSSGPSSAPAPTTRQARLADLFRPPYDLIEHVSSWDEARSIGKDEKRWILANIQDLSDFQCQALNRDIWKDEAIKQLVRENFVFLQYSKDDILAESYIQYYLPGGQDENPDNYPHIGVVDPRTGEQVKVWSGRPFPTALEFHAQLAEFLDRYSLDAAKKNPVQRSKPQAVVKDVGRMTEDEMLEMALRNSLATAGGGEGSGGRSGSASGGSNGVQDPDELTGTPAPEAQPDADADDDEADGSSAFAAIAADQPHEEPPTSAPAATTTRIQFRHPTGRVIRRFATDDRVVRIYEWLKAAPLEGREGLAFELKVMPQGHNLLEDLDKTIEEASLKQATVMIEFLE